MAADRPSSTCPILKHLERMDYGQLKEIYTGMEAYMAGLKAVDEALLKKMNV